MTKILKMKKLVAHGLYNSTLYKQLNLPRVKYSQKYSAISKFIAYGMVLRQDP